MRLICSAYLRKGCSWLLFGKNKVIDTEKIDSIIGKNMTIEGKVISEGSLRVEGIVMGNIEAKGDVYIGETGKVEGNLEVRNLLIAGEITGNLRILERLEITKNGRLEGDIETKILVVEEGAEYHGRCVMGTLKNDKKETV